MKKFLLLTRCQLGALLATLHLSGGSRKRAASSWMALALICALCLYLSSTYSFALAGQLAAQGALELLIVLMSAIAVMAGLLSTVFAAQGIVFGGRDADLLLSMPVSAFSVLLSKLTALYAVNLAFTVFILLPAGAAFLWQDSDGGALFLLRLAVGAVFLALLPTVLALAAGAILSWMGGRFGNRGLPGLLCYGLMMLAVAALAFRINLTVSTIAAGTFTGGPDVPGSAWELPFRLFQRGVCGDWETLVMFCLLSLLLTALAAAALSARYQQILGGQHSHGRRRDFQLIRLRAVGPRRALLQKEASRYFGTPIYLFNTGIGPVLLVVAGIAAVLLRSRLREMLAGFAEMPMLLLLAAAVLFPLSMTAVTASSISLEGKNLWILKEAPLAAGAVFAVKVLFQLLLELPCLLVGTAGMAWGVGLSAAEGGALFALGAAFSGFTALLGLTVNLCLPKLDALNDTVVVKMSAATMLSLLSSMAAAVLCAALMWRLGGVLGAVVSLAVLLAGSLALALWLRRRGARRFLEL